MNNGIGTYEDFEGIVLNSFSAEVLGYCGITQAELQAKFDRYKSFISNSQNLSNLFKSCL